MTAVLTPAAPAPPQLWPEALLRPDEGPARRALRAQIARLETEAGAMDPPLRTAEIAYGTPAAPRMLTLGDLERTRDRLQAAIATARRARDELGARQQEARALRERALLDPEGHPWVRVTNTDIGEPGCHDWHVRPRFGLLGMLMRWWRVRISSGCP
jgi:hypothetical protein